VKPCLKFWGLPRKHVWYVRGLLWKLVGYFGSRNHLKSVFRLSDEVYASFICATINESWHTYAMTWVMAHISDLFRLTDVMAYVCHDSMPHICGISVPWLCGICVPWHTYVAYVCHGRACEGVMSHKMSHGTHATINESWHTYVAYVCHDSFLVAHVNEA